MLEKKLLLKGLFSFLTLTLSTLTLASTPHTEEPLLYHADVVVVGAGSAGLSAALEVANHHACVRENADDRWQFHASRGLYVGTPL